MSEDRFTPPKTHHPSAGLIRVETCGNCLFGTTVQEDLTIVECHGTPPTPAIAGMTANGPAIVMLRCRLPRSEPGCALHRKQLVLAS